MFSSRSGKVMAMLVAIMVCSSLLFAGESTYNREDVNLFDRQLMFPYSEPLSITSEITQYSAMLSPASLALAAPPEDWFGIAMTYAAAGGFSFGTRTLMKMAIERNRPYMYFDVMPDPGSTLYDELIADKDDSFPSGHAIMAFTGAAFTHTMFALRYADSPYRKASTITAWSLAAATAALRVASGNHFVSDVLVGGAIGTFFGFAVPYLAWNIFPSWKGERVSVAIGPAMVSMQVQL